MAENAINDFQQSLKEYVIDMGVIPREDQMVGRDEYLALIRKYENLKEKSLDQEETIKHLKMLLEIKDNDQTNLLYNIQDMAKGQSEILQNIIKNVTSFFASKDDSSDQKKIT